MYTSVDLHAWPIKEDNFNCGVRVASMGRRSRIRPNDWPRKRERMLSFAGNNWISWAGLLGSASGVTTGSVANHLWNTKHAPCFVYLSVLGLSRALYETDKLKWQSDLINYKPKDVITAKECILKHTPYWKEILLIEASSCPGLPELKR